MGHWFFYTREMISCNGDWYNLFQMYTRAINTIFILYPSIKYSLNTRTYTLKAMTCCSTDMLLTPNDTAWVWQTAVRCLHEHTHGRYTEDPNLTNQLCTAVLKGLIIKMPFKPGIQFLTLLSANIFQLQVIFKLILSPLLNLGVSQPSQYDH